MSELPPKILRQYETNEDPNFFWFEIPGTSLRVNIKASEIDERGLAYLDEIALEIESYIMIPDEDTGIPVIDIPVMVRMEIPQKVNTYGGAILFYIKVGSDSPEIMIGEKANEHIQKLDQIYFSNQTNT